MVATQLTEESTSRFADIGGRRVHYNEAGSGPAVVMLHGGGPGATGWSNFQRNAGPIAEKHRVLLVDQPGYGQTEFIPPVSEAASTIAARVVRDLLDQLGVDKASLVGNSMGGQNSVAFALDYPDRIDKLILMGAAGAGQSMFVPTPTEGIKILMHTFQEPTIENMRELIEVMVYDSSFLTDELLQQRVKAALATRRPGAPPIGGASGAPQREISTELGKVKAKTLVIWGRDDRVVPLDWSLRFLWGIPDAQLHVFSKCGHWAQFEHALEFNRLVEDFLANN